MGGNFTVGSDGFTTVKRRRSQISSDSIAKTKKHPTVSNRGVPVTKNLDGQKKNTSKYTPKNEKKKKKKT
ncbi:hypothetical protein AYI68_g6503 [Smittium mucronatum]|uniref:Uncharacterized protein n=1 Tax=Smittium mucronatum TaxID=133383 RepID=A0A1R0GRB4_9FUNG|nr:hypothetical protein AYI68_g6503 [Smittium mucronatum]